MRLYRRRCKCVCVCAPLGRPSRVENLLRDAKGTRYYIQGATFIWRGQKEKRQREKRKYVLHKTAHRRYLIKSILSGRHDDARRRESLSLSLSYNIFLSFSLYILSRHSPSTLTEREPILSFQSSCHGRGAHIMDFLHTQRRDKIHFI